MDPYDVPPVELVAYTAGLFDGEGWCGHSVKNASYKLWIGQSEGNDGEDLCRWLHSQWGLGIVSCQSRTTNLGVYSVMWMWQVGARWDTRFVLRTLLPFLHVKRVAALRVIGAVEATPPKYRLFTPREDDFIRDNLARLGPYATAARLGRSYDSLRTRSKHLGLGGLPDRRRRTTDPSDEATRVVLGAGHDPPT